MRRNCFIGGNRTFEVTNYLFVFLQLENTATKIREASLQVSFGYIVSNPRLI